MKEGIMLFSEYRVVNALEIQKQINLNNDSTIFESTKLIIRLYIQYLAICGIKDISSFYRHLDLFKMKDLSFEEKERVANEEKQLNGKMDNLLQAYQMEHLEDFI
jgi:hypothetical protein